ncbi:MAG: hypothetical protein H6R01_1508 [Burkholderiaceae bacterium]|nr:hypothetical protein [Burkholderiaceae bacterium]
MQRATHGSVVSIIQHHVNEWRKRQRWSRETAAMCIVEAHESLGIDKISGIEFDPPTRDKFERARVNADRIFRWLDDQSKDTNLLPVNFLPSVLWALPIADRVRCVSDVVRSVGVSASAVASGAGRLDAVGILQNIIKECSEAHNAVAALVDGATRDELLDAQRELSEAISAMQSGLRDIEVALSCAR